MNNEKYMKIALSLAKKAFKNGDIPIGAIVVDKNGVILGKGYNRKEKDKNALNHAEIIAIKQACKKIDSWRLEECTIYSTLEPCLMCVGAILQARINHIVFGLASNKFGCVESLYNLSIDKKFNHCSDYTHQPLPESKELLQTFFNQLRNQNDMV